MQVTPNFPTGHRTNSMIVVICPVCKQKRWANIRKDHSLARTTCCGETVVIATPPVLRTAPMAVKKAG